MKFFGSLVSLVNKFNLKPNYLILISHHDKIFFISVTLIVACV